MDTVTESPAWTCQFCGRNDFDNLQQRSSHFATCEAYDRAIVEIAQAEGITTSQVKSKYKTTDARYRAWQALTSGQQSETVSGLFDALRERAGSYGEVPDALHESGTDRDGLLSYAAEWHAMLFGIAAGVMVAHNPEYFDLLIGLLATAFGVERVGRVVPQIKERYLSQIRDEVHYFMGGAIIGHVYVQWLNGEALIPDVSQVVNATTTLL